MSSRVREIMNSELFPRRPGRRVVGRLERDPVLGITGAPVVDGCRPADRNGHAA
jgi:hypothetical protein